MQGDQKRQLGTASSHSRVATSPVVFIIPFLAPIASIILQLHLEISALYYRPHAAKINMTFWGRRRASMVATLDTL